VAPWTEVRDQLNRVLRGWTAYFSYGSRALANRALEHHVWHRVCRFLRRRHKADRGGKPDTDVFGRLGVLRPQLAGVAP
jgi:RNA-directed DNA polymerase